MAQFIYQAVNKQGKNITGTVEAADRANGIEALIKQNLQPISLKVKSDKEGVSAIFSRFFGSKVKPDALVIFTRQLSTMIGAGVPLLRSINALKEHVSDKTLGKVLDTVDQDIRG